MAAPQISPGDGSGLPFAGIELGGTKCIAILAEGPDQIHDRATLPTRHPDETLPALNAVLDRWQFAALGVASFGPLERDSRSPEHGRIFAAAKPGWSGASLLPLAKGRNIPFTIETDVNAAAIAEGIWGAAQDLTSWAYITVGTGIGVGTIIDRRPVIGLGHSEAGHLRVPRGEDRWPGICSFHGDCVEGLASGPAIAARAGRPGHELRADDPIWEHVADAIAALCHNLVYTALPERILIGGGVGVGQPQLYPLIRAKLEKSLAGFSSPATRGARWEDYIGPPALSAMAGPLGAIALAQQALAVKNL